MSSTYPKPVIIKGNLFIDDGKNTKTMGTMPICNLKDVKLSKLKKIIKDALSSVLLSNEDFMETLYLKVYQYYSDQLSKVFNQMNYDSSSEEEPLSHILKQLVHSSSDSSSSSDDS